MRVRFADLRSVTRSLTLPAPVAATAILAEVAEDLVRGVLARSPAERTISLLAISVSNLEEQAALQLELPLGLPTRRAARQPQGRGALARRPRASTRSATASAGRRSATRRSCSARRARCRTRSASSPRRSCDVGTSSPG